MLKKNTTHFAQALRNEGIEVLYLEQLAAESLTSPEIRDQFIEEYLEEANIRGRQTKTRFVNCFAVLKTTKNWLKKQWRGSKS